MFLFSIWGRVCFFEVSIFWGSFLVCFGGGLRVVVFVLVDLVYLLGGSFRRFFGGSILEVLGFLFLLR